MKCHAQEKYRKEFFYGLPFIQLPLNGFHCKLLPFTSDSKMRRPFIRDPSSSVKKIMPRRKNKNEKNKWQKKKIHS